MSEKRNLKEIIELLIKDLTDEEIVVAARYLLKSKFALLAYEAGNEYCFITTHKGGHKMIKNLQEAWEEKFGKFEILEEE